MADNQQQRDELQSAMGLADPERAQYLEDERLALCLQNEEFLRELRGDEDFMKTLQRGVCTVIRWPLSSFWCQVS